MEFKKMAKKIILYVILIIVCISLTSCQTIQGVGGDIQWTGKKSAEMMGDKNTKAEERERGEKRDRGEEEEDRY
jgi:predicted small secreted protein